MSPDIVGRLATSELGRQQDIETQKAKVEKLKAEADVKTKGYASLYTTYGKSPEAMQIINDNASIGNPPEKALADIQALRTAKAGKSTTTIGGTNPLTTGEAKGMNVKETLRRTGVNYDNFTVKISGDDNAPQAEIRTPNTIYRKTNAGFFWGHADSKTWNKIVKKGDKWKAAGGNKTGKDTIDPAIIKSLNDGYTDFQNNAFAAKGKNIGFSAKDLAGLEIK